ncbi:uncharacterized protein LOC127722049 [Mytilus californianus]|uniref:uncharacterized protein LOC127722049 n=1 Tax=Mytilus californianus TaxID=6549 RepID=UPI0022462C72|nr:uncharacterized protein LOC127722049 [Mytilus californianus]
MSDKIVNVNDWKYTTLQYLYDMRESECASYEKNRKAITERKNALEDEIERYANKMLQELNKPWMKLNETITKQEKQLLQSDLTLERTFILPTNQVPQFSDGNLSEECISKIFGSLVNRSYISEEIELSKIKSYDTDVLYTNPICPINDQTLLIGCAADKVLKQVTMVKKCKEINALQEIKVSSIIAQSSGKVILSESNDTFLKLLVSDGSLQQFVDFNPLIPKGIFITDENEVFVGLREKTTNPFVIDRYSERQVRHLDSHSRTRHIYEFDENQKRLFTVPSRIIASNLNIHVIDTEDEDNGRIITLDFPGNVQWIYNGHAFSKYAFCPNDFALSPQGYLVVTDTYNDALHFLNNQGDILLYKTLSIFGISLPCSVAIDFKSQLWVGTGRDKTKCAKVHVLSMFK